MIDLSEFKVTVIVPCFNHNDLLDRCLSSIENQTHKNIQVIVIDDGSNIPVALARSYEIGQVTVIRQDNSGLSAARNTGIKVATGCFVKFLDADDELKPSCLEEQLAMLVATNGRAVNVCGFIEKYESHEYEIIPAFSAPVDALINLNIGPPHCYLFPQTVFSDGFEFSTEDKVNGGHEDYDFVFRLALNGYDFSTLHKPLVIYHKSENSMSANQDKMRKTLILVWADTVSALLKGQFGQHNLSRSNQFCILVRYFELVLTAPEPLAHVLMALQPELLTLLDRLSVHLSAAERDRLLFFCTQRECLNTFYAKLSCLTTEKKYIRQPHRQRINDIDFFLYGFYTIYDSELLRVIDFVFSYKGFSIYGAGELGEKLVLLLSKMGKSPDFIVDKKANNKGIHGVACITPASYHVNNIEHVIIASRAYRDEIRSEIERSFINIKAIIDI